MEVLKIVLTVVLCAVVSLIISVSVCSQTKTSIPEIGVPEVSGDFDPTAALADHQHTLDPEILFPMIQNSFKALEKVVTSTEMILKTHTMRLDSHNLLIKRQTLRMNLTEKMVEAQVMLIGEISKEQMENRKN